MKSLKESILSRSSHGGDASKKRMIEEWLKEYNIKNYTINDDLTIDVNGFVFLNKENLSVEDIEKYVDENKTHIVLYSYNSYISIAKEDIETIYNTSDYKFFVFLEVEMCYHLS